MIPAFSPGPCTTLPGPVVRVPRVGNRFRWTRLLLYEQCSLHITLKIPNSVRLGTRPIFFLMLAYSSAVMLCVFSSSGVIPTGVGTAFVDAGFAVVAVACAAVADPAGAELAGADADAVVTEEGTAGAETSGAETSTAGSIG
jgi:hypothetical protein